MDFSFLNTKLDRATPLLVGVLVFAIVGMALGVAAWQANQACSRMTPTRVSLPQPSADHHARKMGALVLYLVNSPEQWDWIFAKEDAASTERAMSGIPDPESSFLVMQDVTPEDALSVQKVLEAWASSTGGVSVVDYRSQ